LLGGAMVEAVMVPTPALAALGLELTAFEVTENV